MLGFLFCFVVSVLEWFLLAKRTELFMKANAWVGPIAAIEVAIGLGAGYVVFVQQNLPALIACALGAGLGADLARRRK